MMVLPIFFITFLLRFPMGLVIYWVTTNLWTVGQGLVTRRLTQRTPLAKLQRRSSRTPSKAEPEPAGDGTTKREPAQAQAAAPQQPRKVKRKKRARR
jgi:YidC/Oxa1 family membrane protein insertase